MADFKAPSPQLASMDGNDTEETWKQLKSLNGTNGHDENSGDEMTLNGESSNKESSNSPGMNTDVCSWLFDFGSLCFILQVAHDVK